MKTLFSTQFPLNSHASLEDLLETKKNWIRDSPHSPIGIKDLSQLNKHGDYVKDGEYLVELGRSESNNCHILGIRYSTPFNRDRLSTTVISLKNEEGITTLVNVDYDSSGARITVPIIKKPFIIKSLIDSIGGGQDGYIPVSDEPIHLTEGDVELIAKVLNGLQKSSMPIVYMSRNINNLVSLRQGKLANLLSGIANVFVEPSRNFSYKLRDLTSGKNVYGGTIGVYWPNEGGRLSFFGDDFLKEDPEKAIYQKIVDALSSRRLPIELTWDHIQSLNNLKAIKLIRDGHEQDTDSLLNLYTDELSNKDRQLIDASRRISTLEDELRRTRGRTNYGGELINDPQIIELYPGEVKNTIIETLRGSVNYQRPTTRKDKILLRTLKSNVMNDSTRKEIIEKIKKIFKDYRGINGSMRSELQRMGFLIEDGGKHYKLYLKEEGRDIFVAIPKTPSDHRSGMNTSSDIIRTFL